jgi:branched-subunit amino acid transport protein
MTRDLLLIAGMAAVTLLPRIAPSFLAGHPPPFLRKWLDAVPYAALGALIFPGILSAGPDGRPAGGVVAGSAALVAAWLGLPAFVAAFAAVAAVLAMEWAGL